MRTGHWNRSDKDGGRSCQDLSQQPESTLNSLFAIFHLQGKACKVSEKHGSYLIRGYYKRFDLTVLKNICTGFRLQKLDFTCAKKLPDNFYSIKTNAAFGDKSPAHLFT